MKTEAQTRKYMRLYMRQYRAEKEKANGPRHPTLSNEELAAVEECIAMDETAWTLQRGQGAKIIR